MFGYDQSDVSRPVKRRKGIQSPKAIYAKGPFGTFLHDCFVWLQGKSAGGWLVRANFALPLGGSVFNPSASLSDPTTG